MKGIVYCTKTRVYFTLTAFLETANIVHEGEVGFTVAQLVHSLQPLTGGFFAKTLGLASCICGLACCLAHLQGRPDML